MKRILTYAGILIAAVLIVWLLISNRQLKKDAGTRGIDLRRTDKTLAKKLEASEAEIKRLRGLVKVWTDSVSTFKLSKQEADRKAAISNKRYNDLKNSIPVRYSDSNIDSVIRAITRY